MTIYTIQTCNIFFSRSSLFSIKKKLLEHERCKRTVIFIKIKLHLKLQQIRLFIYYIFLLQDRKMQQERSLRFNSWLYNSYQCNFGKVIEILCTSVSSGASRNNCTLLSKNEKEKENTLKTTALIYVSFFPFLKAKRIQ